jgi:hypothetical protein
MIGPKKRSERVKREYEALPCRVFFGAQSGTHLDATALSRRSSTLRRREDGWGGRA